MTSSAAAYEALLVPEVFRPWAELMVREAGIRAGMRTLDVACGTGVVARCAARLCGAGAGSTGIDIDAAMIEVARATTISEELDVAYHCGSAMELPFQSARFDAAFCLHGLQYFPDKATALSELHRVMRKNGIVVIATWTEMRECAGHWAMISELERRNIDAKDMRKPFALSDPAGLHGLAERAGFESVTVQTLRRTARFQSVKAFVESIAQGAPSSRLALAQVPAAEWPDFLAYVEAQLVPWSPGGRLEFPMASNLLSARR